MSVNPDTCHHRLDNDEERGLVCTKCDTVLVTADLLKQALDGDGNDDACVHALSNVILACAPPPPKDLFIEMMRQIDLRNKDKTS